jgi:chemotaxis protein MotA
MFSIIGVLVVLGAIVGGYLMEGGKIAVLLQPAELLIIGGAAVGSALIANPPHLLKAILLNLKLVLTGSKYTRARYVDSLKMLYDLFNHARKVGLAGIEADMEQPEKSKAFAGHPAILKEPVTRAFICDTMRTAAAGVVEPFDLDQMMEADLETLHHEAKQPVSALSTVADSLPGMGIVAAVLGVVITMGAIGGPPEEVGEKVAAALVGTFLGILLCYGFVGPLAASMGRLAEEEKEYLNVLRVTIIAFVKGLPPIMAVEMGRRVVPGHVRPGFTELEKVCRNKQQPPAAAAAA